jgi:uncharacterized protein YndB with AHSA1/START domain
MSLTPMELFVSRWVKAPAGLVFRAFTESALLERWFCPAEEVALRVERCDARAGGGYRFVFDFPDGTVTPVIGEYRVVEPPNRLVFTWTWENPNPWAGVVTLVTVRLVERDGGTDVRVHHADFTTAEMKDRHEGGWPGTLDRLPALIRALSGETP